MNPKDPFTEMAARIDRNPEFGGAYVICPPGMDPIVHDISVVSTTDPTRFWAAVKMAVDAVITQIDEKARRQQSFMR